MGRPPNAKAGITSEAHMANMAGGRLRPLRDAVSQTLRTVRVLLPQAKLYLHTYASAPSKTAYPTLTACTAMDKTRYTCKNACDAWEESEEKGER